MRLFVLFLLITASTLIACAQKPRSAKAGRASVSEGICGTVVEKRGNHMPGPGSPRPNAGGSPVVREVLVFPLLNMSQVEAGENGFINSVRDAKPVKTVMSGKDGKFCVNVPPGRYSVLVREPKGLYANLSDSQNNINPVQVEKGKKAKATVEITHEAVF
jgi:hypothetical protein